METCENILQEVGLGHLTGQERESCLRQIADAIAAEIVTQASAELSDLELERYQHLESEGQTETADHELGQRWSNLAEREEAAAAQVLSDIKQNQLRINASLAPDARSD